MDKIKLFRGYKSNPHFLVPKLKEEYELLESQFQSVLSKLGDDKNVLSVITEMGLERFTRLHELRKIAGPQFFTDDEGAARAFAGEKGVLIIMEMEKELAQEHYKGMQVMSPDGKQRYVDNFVFNGTELSEHLSDWIVGRVEIERETSAIEGESPFKMIRSEDDLSSNDREAIKQWRDIHKEGEDSPGGETLG